MPSAANAFAALRLADDGAAGGARRGGGARQRSAARRAVDSDGASSDDSYASSDDDHAGWQVPPRWACGVCTFGGNVDASDNAECSLCGAPRQLPPPPPVAVVWRCDGCTLDNAAASRACEACGAPRQQQQALPPPPPPAAAAWRCRGCTLDNAASARACEACGAPSPGVTAAAEAPPQAAAWLPLPPPASRHVSWACGTCTLVNAALRATCEACGAPAAAGAPSASPAAAPPRCVACTPRRACPAHRALRLRAAAAAAEAREEARLAAWVSWESRGLAPLPRRDASEDAAALAHVDARTRAATLAAARAHGVARDGAAPREAPSSEQFRDMYGSASTPAAAAPAEAGPAPGEPRLDTDWEAGREPRRRVALLQAAGWRPVYRTARGGVGSHPKWRRELPGGRYAQVVTFASTPSMARFWDNTAAALARRDRQARALLGIEDAGGDGGGADSDGDA